MKLDYNQYVDQLPATGYTSDGKLLWQPRWSDTLSSNMTLCADVRGSYSTSKSTELYSFASNLPASSAFSFSYPLDETNLVYISLHNVASHFFRAPISGKYTCLNTSIVSAASYRFEDGTIESQKRQWSYAQFSKVVSAGSSVGIYNNSGRQLCSALDIIQCSMTLYTPVYVVGPYDTDMVTNNYYISTRVDNLTGIYVDNSDNYYTDVTIVDETNNKYYDMATNTYYDIKSWSYDYSSRTYFLTLDNDVELTVQFGDTNVTITNNNVSNTYNYVVEDDTGSDPDTPTTCKHDWQETIDTAPTCLEGGHASYTCSKCGETYEQILAAKGHDWKVIEHVNMVYNSDGTVATQGHTLYQCSVCGEQWYTDTGAPPPDVSGSSNILAWLQSFQTWLEEKLDLTPVLERLDAILAQLQDTSGSATCEHTYQQHMEQDADCTLPGLQVSTCSQCGDSYSEIIDPLGHDWVISSHVDAVTDPDTGEETASAYDIYTCSRCGKTYEDHTGDGAPDKDYSSSSISQLVVKVFSKLGTFAGKLIGFIVRLFDKAISSVDEVISKFNEYTEQISGFGGDYPAWLTGFWTVLPSELQVALTFAVVCMVLGIVGKKLFFS
nr:MAG TPA: zinc-ribbon domain protein [Inoviridae sp.]